MTTANAVEVPPNSGPFSWLRAVSRPSLLALGVGILALVSGVASYATVMGFVPYKPTQGGLIAILLVKLSLGLTLAALIAWRLTRLWSARRSGIAGARLH